MYQISINLNVFTKLLTNDITFSIDSNLPVYYENNEQVGICEVAHDKDGGYVGTLKLFKTISHDLYLIYRYRFDDSYHLAFERLDLYEENHKGTANQIKNLIV